MVLKNNYNVVNCGENTAHVIDLLEKLSTALLPVIQDAKSTRPSSAYTTFFKDPLYRSFISTILTNISTGDPMTPPSFYSFNGGVAFFCVTAPGQFQFELGTLRDSYEDCMANPTTTSYFPLFVPPKPYVIVCPSFFTRNIAALPPPNHCLSVNTFTNRFRGNGQTFWLYQIWVLMSMIAHYYLWTSTQIPDLINTNDANTLLGLAPSQSRYSSNSYVYYAASKSFFFSFLSFSNWEEGWLRVWRVKLIGSLPLLGIYGQCRRFPKLYDPNREILEVDLTEPAANASFVPGPTAVTWGATDLRIDGQAV